VIAYENEDDILAPARQSLYAQIGLAIASALITLAIVYAAPLLADAVGKKR
jgi:hypothetical protein